MLRELSGSNKAVFCTRWPLLPSFQNSGPIRSDEVKTRALECNVYHICIRARAISASRSAVSISLIKPVGRSMGITEASRKRNAAILTR